MKVEIMMILTYEVTDEAALRASYLEKTGSETAAPAPSVVADLVAYEDLSILSLPGAHVTGRAIVPDLA